MTNIQAEKIVKALDNIDIGVSTDDIKDIETVEELQDYLDGNGLFDVEIIYYNNAMNYLHDHDSSLNRSLELAMDMGYTIEDIDSEKLASLLASENARNDFNGLTDQIEAILEDNE